MAGMGERRTFRVTPSAQASSNSVAAKNVPEPGSAGSFVYRQLQALDLRGAAS